MPAPPIATTRGGCESAMRSETATPSSSAALCGCVPTEQNTDVYFSAIARIVGNLRTRVEMVIICLTPAACARATMSSRSASKSGKSRWQWVSISIAASRLGRHVTREDRARRFQRRAAGKPSRLAQRREIAFVGRCGDEIEQLAAGCGHEGLQQD